MDCFNHRGTPAVGICRYCGRGVCTECAVEVRNALACRGRCEQYVRQMQDLGEWSFAQPARQLMALASARVWRLAIGCVLFILGFFLGLTSINESDPNVVFGIMIALAGLACIGASRAKALRPVRSVRICPTCGYNLTGNTSGRCPECGSAFAGDR